MRLSNIVLLVSISVFLTSLCFGQAQIQYGSNNGKYISLHSTKIYYEDYGEGPALLLLYGGFGNIHTFAKVIPELSKHFRVIRTGRFSKLSINGRLVF